MNFSFRQLTLLVSIFFLCTTYALANDINLAPTSILLAQKLDEKMVKGRIYNKKFIEKERADNRVTVVFDLDETLGFSYGANGMGIPYILRPQIENSLRILKQNNVKIVLWTYADQPRTRAFFYNHPELLTYFDRIITAENFFVAKPNEIEEAYNTPNLEPIKNFNSSHILAKHISVLGYDIIVDDSSARITELKLSKKLLRKENYRYGKYTVFMLDGLSTTKILRSSETELNMPKLIREVKLASARKVNRLQRASA